jgi:hypothetical protein
VLLDKRILVLKVLGSLLDSLLEQEQMDNLRNTLQELSLEQ